LRFFFDLKTKIMKKILLVTDFFRPEPGGLEGLFTGIARHWESGSLEVVVATGDSNYIIDTEERKLFDDSESYPIFRISPSPSSLKQYLKKADQEQDFENFIQQRIEEFSPRHIILGQISESARHVRYSLADYDLPYSIFLNGQDYKNKLGFFNFRDRRLVLKARNVFTVSRYLARGAKEFGINEDKIIVLPPGMVLRWPSVKRGRRKLLPEYLADKTKNRIVLIGMGPLVPLKGLDLAIEALAELQDLHNRIHFIIMGSGPEYSFLDELIRIRGLENVVSLTGFLPDDHLARVMEHGDIFIQPGCEREDDVESLGTALMEAAWFGLPAIAGKIGGTTEIVRHGISGFIIEPGKANDLSRRIRELVTSDRLRSRMVKTAREIARSEFDMTRTCDAIASRI